MPPRIKVGVVGLGYFGTFHARHYAAIPGAELVATADPNEARGAIVRSTFGEIHQTDHRALIGRVDAVSIAAPTALHHRIAADFIDAGVHVLVEKPLADTAAAARDLAGRAERARVVLHVGHIERFSPAYQAIRQRVDAPRLIECRRHAPWTGRVTEVDVVLDLMIHDIDLALDLAGAATVGVEGSGVAMMGHGLDAVVARLWFANGAVAHLSASRVAPLPSRTVVVHEAERALAADLGAKTATEFTAAGAVKAAIAVPEGDALRLEIQAFLEAIGGRAGQGVEGRAAAEALEIAEAIRTAAS